MSAPDTCERGPWGETQSAWWAAMRMANWITSGSSDLGAEYNDHDLLVMLRAYAYRARHPLNANGPYQGDRTQWVQQWRMIRACLALRNLHLVCDLVDKFSPDAPDRPDLLEQAIAGLVRAIDQFNPSAGFPFSNYARTLIERALVKARRAACPRSYDGGQPFDTEPEEYEHLLASSAQTATDSPACGLDLDELDGARTESGAMLDAVLDLLLRVLEAHSSPWDR